MPLLINNEFYEGIIFQTFLWAGLAISWNLMGGYAGQFSIGHIAFFGIGAYTSTILNIRFAIIPWIGIIIGGLIAIVIGVLLGVICFRLRGIFYTLATLAFGQIIFITAMSYRELTKGSAGLLVPPKIGWSFMSFNNKLPYVYIAMVYMAVLLILTAIIERSKLGYYLMAYREDDEAARVIGVNTLKARLIIASISSFFMAVGGTIYAQYIFYIDPNSVLAINLSVQVALITIVGGLGSVFGPVLGAFLIIPLSQLLRAWLGGAIPGLHMIIYGVILIIVLLVIPDGLFPFIKDLWKKNLLTGRGAKNVKNKEFK